MQIDTLVIQIFLLFIAIGANLMSAFAGGGAGLVQLPALIFLGLPFSQALATHKFASVALGIGASIRHSKEATLNRLIAGLVICCGLPGVLIGSRIILSVSNELATLFLGFLTLLLGIYSIRRPSLGSRQRKVSITPRRIFVGGVILFMIGLLNGSLSSGTGLFVTLWLVSWFGLSFNSAIAYTLILVGVFWNGLGAFALGLNGGIKWEWLTSLIIGSLVGGYLGSHLSISSTNSLVKKAFESVSMIVGISLLLKGIS